MGIKSEISVIRFVYMGVIYPACVYVCTYNLYRVNSVVLLI